LRLEKKHVGLGVSSLLVKSKSAVKRHKQSEVRRLSNKNVKSSLRTSAKKVVASVQKKDGAQAKDTMLALIKELDTAARKGIIKKNTAARKKSRLQKLVNTLSA
jgi:small subunit ribosomal protein S20